MIAIIIVMSYLNMVIKNKICVCGEQADFENLRTFADIEVSVQLLIFITLETRDKTCSKIENQVSICSMGDEKR